MARKPTPVRVRVEWLKERLKQGPLRPREQSERRRLWRTETRQFARDEAQARAELAAEAQPEAVRSRVSLEIDRALADAAEITDPSKRSAARVRAALALLDLHGLRKPMAPDGDPKPAAQLTLAEQAAADRAAKGSK